MLLASTTCSDLPTSWKINHRAAVYMSGLGAAPGALNAVHESFAPQGLMLLLLQSNRTRSSPAFAGLGKLCRCSKSLCMLLVIVDQLVNIARTTSAWCLVSCSVFMN